MGGAPTRLGRVVSAENSRRSSSDSNPNGEDGGLGGRGGGVFLPPRNHFTKRRNSERNMGRKTSPEWSSPDARRQRQLSGYPFLAQFRHEVKRPLSSC